MQSNFEKSQSNKILSCYSLDIKKGGKPATIGEVRIWGGKRYTKVQGGWMEYDRGNKKIDNSRKVKDPKNTERQEKIMSEDSVILHHIRNLSPEEKKQKLSQLDEKVKHLKKLNDLRTQFINDSDKRKHANELNHASYSDHINKLTKKKAEIEYGDQTAEDLDTEFQSTYEQWQVEDDDIIKKELFEHLKNVHHALYRHHSEESRKDLLTRGGNYSITQAHLDSINPWTEDMYQLDFDPNEADELKAKFDQLLFEEKHPEIEIGRNLNKKFKEYEGKFSSDLLYQLINSNGKLPGNTKLQIEFDGDKKAERTWDQLSKYISDHQAELRNFDAKTKPKDTFTNKEGVPVYWGRSEKYKDLINKWSDERSKRVKVPIKKITIVN